MVDHGRPVVGYPEQARAALRICAYQQLRHIDCELRDGALQLRGAVGSFYLKQVAQVVVSHVLPQSITIDNRIRVVEFA